jgi:uncharacterized protein (DUF2267 family)
MYFDDMLHKTNVWLKENEEILGSDRKDAYQPLRAVIHCICDRLTVDEAAQLDDQLPMLIRRIYCEGWHPAGTLEKVRSRDEFLAWIGTRLPKTRLIDREGMRRVLSSSPLEHHVSAGDSAMCYNPAMARRSTFGGQRSSF